MQSVSKVVSYLASRLCIYRHVTLTPSFLLFLLPPPPHREAWLYPGPYQLGFGSPPATGPRRGTSTWQQPRARRVRDG